MVELEETRIKTLLAKGKYKDAGRILNDFVLTDKKNDTAWYFLGVLAMKLNNYSLAHEYFERAIMIKKVPEYLLFDGLAYLESLDVDDAILRFSEYIRMDSKNSDVYFYLAICYMLKGDPRSSVSLKKASSLNKERTMQMLRDFFHHVVEKNPVFDAAIKSQIRKKLS